MKPDSTVADADEVLFRLPDPDQCPNGVDVVRALDLLARAWGNAQRASTAGAACR